MTSVESQLQKISKQALRAFLTFAESVLPPHGPLASSVNKSIFVEHVHNALIQVGNVIDCDIGYQEFTIDIAVRHLKKKSIYTLAILLDSQSYVSCHNARDRDRLHDAVLEQLD
ncbi:MAG: hypothetical protein GX639_19145 [Fibrobacter sp.]|nr:hypothetical protein [Fibrobacter sp.]